MKKFTLLFRVTRRFDVSVTSLISIANTSRMFTITIRERNK